VGEAVFRRMSEGNYYLGENVVTMSEEMIFVLLLQQKLLHRNLNGLIRFSKKTFQSMPNE
jgi:hypothetical protein